MKHINHAFTIDKKSYIEISDTDLKKHYFQWSKLYKQIDSDISISHKNFDIIGDPFSEYGGYNHKSINHYMRNQKALDARELDILSHLMIANIFYAPRIPENIIVYRGVNQFCDYDFNNEYNSFKELGFLSTSISAEKAEQFASCKKMLKIYVRKNTPGIYMDVIWDRKENEILFPPSAILTLISEPYYDENLLVTIYECTLDYY